jgi:hypothetical protein
MGPVSLTVPPSRKETEKPVHDRLFAFLPGQTMQDLEILLFSRLLQRQMALICY